MFTFPLPMFAFFAFNVHLSVFCDFVIPFSFPFCAIFTIYKCLLYEAGGAKMKFKLKALIASGLALAMGSNYVLPTMTAFAKTQEEQDRDDFMQDFLDKFLNGGSNTASGQEDKNNKPQKPSEDKPSEEKPSEDKPNNGDSSSSDDNKDETTNDKPSTEPDKDEDKKPAEDEDKEQTDKEEDKDSSETDKDEEDDTEYTDKVVDSAESTGDASGNVLDTTSGGVCSGGQVSGLDATVFENIKSGLDLSSSDNRTPDANSGKLTGTVVSRELTCSQSDGFTTDISPAEVLSTHWVAWYKNTKDEEVDKTQDEGNYHGFSQSKVDNWLRYKDALQKVNNGSLPEEKDYTYPADTEGNSSINFWSDIPGYYEVLGDPQYSGLNMSSYQHFTWTIKQTTETYSVTMNLDGANNGTGGGATGGEVPKTSGPGGQETGGTKEPMIKENPIDMGTVLTILGIFGILGSVALGPLGIGVIGGLASTAGTVTGGGFLIGGMKSQAEKNAAGDIDETSSSTLSALSLDSDSGETLPRETIEENVYEDEGGIQFDYVKDTTITYENGSDSVLVASATVGAESYATEIAGFDDLALVAGSEGDKTYDVEETPYWGTHTPGYWKNQGSYTVSNDSSLPYHFAAVSEAGEGENIVNPYSLTVLAPDKVFNTIHGYADITQVDGLEKNSYPKSEPKACIEVDGKETCSSAKTPLVNVELNIYDDNPQEQIEAEKFVHLTDYYTTEEEVK